RSSSGTRFGTPASTAGRKNEFAMPTTAASTSTAAGRCTNGSATNTTSRARSETTSNAFRDSLSTSGPAATPRTTVGTSVAIHSALTHHGECVRRCMSYVSAIVAIHVPTEEPTVARNSRRNPAAVRSRAAWRRRDGGNAPPTVSDLGARENPTERRGEGLDLFRGAHGDAYRGGRAEAGERPDDDPLAQQLVEQHLRVSAGVDVQEVADGRHRVEAVVAQHRLEPDAAFLVDGAAAGELDLVVQARERRHLGGRRHVERPAYFRQRRAHVARADGVTDPQPGEAVDLRERAQHDDAAARLQVPLDRIRVVGPVDVLEVRLVDDRHDVLGHALEERVDLAGRVHRAGRVVRLADVDELRARRDRGEQGVEVVRVVAQRDGVDGRALLRGVDHVAGEGRPAADDLVAGIERRLAEHVDAAVGAGADRDLVHRDAVAGGERLVQPVRAAVRVPVQALGRAGERLASGRERPERALVRGELDHALEPELALHVLDGLAGLIRRQGFDAGPEEGHAGRLACAVCGALTRWRSSWRGAGGARSSSCTEARSWAATGTRLPAGSRPARRSRRPRCASSTRRRDSLRPSTRPATSATRWPRS